MYTSESDSDLLNVWCNARCQCTDGLLFGTDAMSVNFVSPVKSYLYARVCTITVIAHVMSSVVCPARVNLQTSVPNTCRHLEHCNDTWTCAVTNKSIRHRYFVFVSFSQNGPYEEEVYKFLHPKQYMNLDRQM